VLVVDDLVSSGETASMVTKWAKDFKPSQVYFASISTYREREKIMGTKLERQHRSKYLFK